MRKKTWRSLILKLKSLSLDLEDHQEIISEHEVEFSKQMQAAAIANISTAPTQPPPPPLADSKELISWSAPLQDKKHSSAASNAPFTPQDFIPSPPEELADNRPEAIKKIWKSIALATHPDKHDGDLELIKIYKQAAQAYQSKNFSQLIQLAVQLELELPMDPDIIAYLQSSIQAVTTQINHLEQTAVWHWIHASEIRKNQIVQQAIGSFKHKR